ncbi:DUF6221 family protein [Streptomyces leeuwenhoekii]|uniref:Sle1_019 protein n=1 Tax=Streptomyces leeuwenhoekii TaxID=1437453 RepID=A0A0F7VQR8_STRLW|nr:DUF6221 family protein [Streptomyces leeuwenhoekii]CQR59186.1 sle1_019 [Streptomyces leeuwenhoekii]
MKELVQFLRERLDDDERRARAATPGPWRQSGIGDYGWTVSFSRPGSGVEAEDSDQGRADADFIAAHDPTRALDEIDAKRRMVNRITYHADLMGWDEVHGDLLRSLASVYSEHPDYQKVWRS